MTTPAIVLGTVQWGLPYGLANRHGPPDDRELREILAAAGRGGLTSLDTAAAYGDSEARIGAMVGPDAQWDVTTKLAPDLDTAASAGAARRRVREGINEAQQRLRRPTIDVVLLHRPAHLTAHGGAIWRALREAREAGAVRSIGVSVADLDDAEQCLQQDGVEIVQLAVSLLDRRALTTGLLGRAADQGIAVIGRSAFLQGAALMNPQDLPRHLRPLVEPLSRMRKWCAERDRDPASTCLAWALSLPLDGIVVGVERADQLQAYLHARSTPLDHVERTELAALIGDLGDAVLDPWRWPPQGQRPTPGPT